MQKNLIEIGNLPLSYKILLNTDNKNNILILHGWGGSSVDWEKVGENLFENTYNIIIPDLPGSGETPRIKIDSIGDYAKIVEDFIDKLKIENLILFGYSSGGAISIELASRKNIKIDTLILNNSAGIGSKHHYKELINKIVKIFQKIPGFNLIKSLVYQILGISDFISYELNKKLREILDEDLQEQMKNIDIKSIIIWSENDIYRPLINGYKIKKLILNSKIHIIKNERHNIHLQNPQLLSETILNSLGKIEKK